MAPVDEATREKARALIDVIRNRLDAGDRYYNKAGEELVTVPQVIKTMLDEDGVNVVPAGPDIDFNAVGGFKEASRQSRK